jgi:hypothetical protein
MIERNGPASALRQNKRPIYRRLDTGKVSVKQSLEKWLKTGALRLSGQMARCSRKNRLHNGSVLYFSGPPGIWTPPFFRLFSGLSVDRHRTTADLMKLFAAPAQSMRPSSIKRGVGYPQAARSESKYIRLLLPVDNHFETASGSESN